MKKRDLKLIVEGIVPLPVALDDWERVLLTTPLVHLLGSHPDAAASTGQEVDNAENR